MKKNEKAFSYIVAFFRIFLKYLQRILKFFRVKTINSNSLQSSKKSLEFIHLSDASVSSSSLSAFGFCYAVAKRQRSHSTVNKKRGQRLESDDVASEETFATSSFSVVFRMTVEQSEKSEKGRPRPDASLRVYSRENFYR